MTWPRQTSGTGRALSRRDRQGLEGGGGMTYEKLRHPIDSNSFALAELKIYAFVYAGLFWL